MREKTKNFEQKLYKQRGGLSNEISVNIINEKYNF